MDKLFDIAQVLRLRVTYSGVFAGGMYNYYTVHMDIYWCMPT